MLHIPSSSAPVQVQNTILPVQILGNKELDDRIAKVNTIGRRKRLEEYQNILNDIKHLDTELQPRFCGKLAKCFAKVYQEETQISNFVQQFPSGFAKYKGILGACKTLVGNRQSSVATKVIRSNFEDKLHEVFFRELARKLILDQNYSKAKDFIKLLNSSEKKIAFFGMAKEIIRQAEISGNGESLEKDLELILKEIKREADSSEKIDEFLYYICEELREASFSELSIKFSGMIKDVSMRGDCYWNAVLFPKKPIDETANQNN